MGEGPWVGSRLRGSSGLCVLSPALSRSCGAEGEWGEMLSLCAPEYKNQPPPPPSSSLPLPKVNAWFRNQTPNPLPQDSPPRRRRRTSRRGLKNQTTKPKGRRERRWEAESKANLFETNGLFLGKDKTRSSSGGVGQPLAPLLLLGTDGRTDGWRKSA